MQFLYWRHPEIGMRLDLAVKPLGSGFLRSHAQEIGASITGEIVQLSSVTVTSAATVFVIVAGFK